MRNIKILYIRNMVEDLLKKKKTVGVFILICVIVFGALGLRQGGKTADLTDEQKQICEEAAAEATEYERQFVVDLEAKAIEELPSLGVQLVTADQVDVESFRTAAAAVNEKYAKELGLEDMMKEIQTIGEKY